MEITYLGHAGFFVETSEMVLVMDSWLSKHGAFDSSWFQFPCNHHLAALVKEKLSENGKDKFIYISHEHKDHFDIEFLNSITNKDFTFIIGDFRREVLKNRLSTIGAKNLIACKDREIIKIPGGFAQLFLDDSELNRDSAIYLSLGNKNFLNFNDCRKLDEVHYIKSQYNKIDVFTCQFSGATWHPTCYEYSKEEYDRISRRKMIGKFETVAKAIETLSPKLYLPSAGPPRFLDPVIEHLNFEENNIFPLSYKFLSYLDKRIKSDNINFFDIMPGDTLDSRTMKFINLSNDRINKKNYEEHISAYINKYRNFFSERRHNADNVEAILGKLRCELQSKLDKLSLSNRISAPLYFILFDKPDKFIKVNFWGGSVTYASQIHEQNHYIIKAPSWEIERVLNRLITWDDFSLTFRMRLTRKPDIYQKIIEAFLVLEAEDLNEFCKKLLEIESKQQRITIDAGGCKYSINKFCPHEGGDLTYAWIEDGRFVVCPRHSWKFDLYNDGKCTLNDESIHAIALENE
ncbi:MAG: Rieske 2Fe-2S domain-containing protein [Chlorobi bacterium]|nr:Rieske 2Fe-2S domain-containing protein [Chlorobiota bacterium]MCI0717121.1 Rieske 2Fe-2S domain-containing protein [Chlorobiota bacterium]